MLKQISSHIRKLLLVELLKTNNMEIPLLYLWMEELMYFIWNIVFYMKKNVYGFTRITTINLMTGL